MRDVVLIDLDGTLVESVDGIHAACVDMTSKLRLPAPSHSFVHRSIGRGADALVARVLAAVSKGVTRPELHAEARREFDVAYAVTWRDGTSLRPDALDMLEVLRGEGRRPIIATNKPRAPAQAIVAHLGLLEAVCGLVTPEDADTRKPDSAFVDFAMAGASRARGALVGDSSVDAETAYGSGIPFVAVRHGYNEGIPIEDSDIRKSVIVERLSQVPAALRRLER